MSTDGDAGAADSRRLTALCLAVDRPTRGDARKIGKVCCFDPVTARLERPGIEPESCDDHGVTIVPIVRVTHERLKEIGAVLSLSESRVSRLLNSALFNLGEFMRTREEA